MASDSNGATHPRLTLVLGGARSGKSRHAQVLAMATPPPWLYIATAEARDTEMQQRIAEHQRTRGDGWKTIEAPIQLADAVKRAKAEAPVVIDCITLWLTNLMLGGYDIDAAVKHLIKALDARKAPTIVVSNDVGGGLVPETELGRVFRDRSGLVNQHLATSAQHVIYMVAGLAMTLKSLP